MAVNTDVRLALALSLVLGACGSSASPGSAGSPTATASSKTASPSSSSASSCQPTTTRDASGVITVDGKIGVVGETSTPAATAMDEPLLIVRRGTVERDRVALRFQNLESSAPAAWVDYGVTAHPRPSPWGAFTFEAGWKPIGFADSCWRLVVDGTDSGLVLHVRP